MGMVSGLSKQAQVGLRARARPRRGPLALHLSVSQGPKARTNRHMAHWPRAFLCNHFLNPNKSLITVWLRWKTRGKDCVTRQLESLSSLHRAFPCIALPMGPESPNSGLQFLNKMPPW